MLRPIVLPLIAAALLPTGLGGCAVAVVGGMAAAGGAGYTAAQERGMGGTIDDFGVKTTIARNFAQANPSLQGSDLQATVYQGRALLTGRVPTPEAKERARQIAAAVPGVRAVYNEIEVGPPASGVAMAQDTWITTRLRSELVMDPNIRSVNYEIDTSDGSVYLIGSARTQAELDLATYVARYIPHVKRVVSYVEVRPGAPVAAQAASSLPQASAPGSDAPTAAPSTPVEVQRL